MAWSRIIRPQRVLIASSHALFGQGLRSLLSERQKADVEVIGVVSNLQEALNALEQYSPDLVIVDYDDEILNRDEFLARFVEGEKKLRVVLLSLQGGEEALVYDRRTLAASAIDDWLEEWTHAKNLKEALTPPKDVAPNAGHRRGDMKHLIIAGILVVVVTALLIVGLGHVQLLPVEASAQAVPIDNLFSLEFKVIAFLFALIVVFMMYSIVVFRRKKGDMTDGPHMEGNMRLEVTWTVIPLITVLYFAYLGGQALAETQRIDPQAMEVNVIGSQWSWRFEYPEWGINSTDLILPVNKQILFHIRSTDVIHSFWVPEFRVKQDALPGGDQFVRDLRITPTKVGDYTVRCAELCGMQHAYMRAPVKVMAQSDFDAWVTSQTAVSNDPVARGKKWAQQYGCVACHTADGSKGVGPTWKGAFGSQVTLSDGSTITADQAYLLESIRNPGAKIVEGFQNIMPPNIAADMTDQQVQDVIAYIESLK
jgi:cytochrome c oxidase subunit 2